MWQDPSELGSCHCITCTRKGACEQRRAAALAGTSTNEPRPKYISNDTRKLDECGPKPRRPNDIIIRNKKAVKKYSQQQHELKRVKSRDSVRLFPWAPDSPFRTKCTLRGQKCKRKKKTPPEPRKKSSLIDLLKQDKDCACEIMSRAVGVGVHRHLGLESRREDINAGLRHPRASENFEPNT